MKPWVLLDRTPIPGSGGDLRLLQRGEEFSINLENGVLMGSRMRGSEEALARLACARLRPAGAARVLVGGYGMGFTLRAALDWLGPDAAVVVAELVPGILAWGRGPLAALSGHSLSDPRVSIRGEDVARTIRAAAQAFDAILLDVDNGPEALTRDSNDRLYRPEGLRAAPGPAAGGVLAVWSAAPDPAFTERLRRTGFAVEEVSVHAHGRKGTRHLVWLAAK